MDNDLAKLAQLQKYASDRIKIKPAKRTLDDIFFDFDKQKSEAKKTKNIKQETLRKPDKGENVVIGSVRLMDRFNFSAQEDNASARQSVAITDNYNNVVRLYLSNFNFSAFPNIIFEFSNLELLCLYDCNITNIPNEIQRLKKLKIVYLESNLITDIPRGLVNLQSLVELWINRNPIENIPKEIVRRGLSSIRNYLDSFDSTTETSFLYEAKLVFVGRGFAGKTSLIRKLTIPAYKLEKNIKSTQGIDIKFWDLEIPLEKSNSFRFNVWDFGGQEKYDSTHQFFITERTLYIFVTEARQESNFLDFDYWLNVVQILGNESPVIVLQNKIDLRKKNLPSEKYIEQFPNILSFVDVSCSDGYEYTIEKLVDVIKSAIKTLPQIGDALPKEWVDIRKELEKKRVDFISYNDYVRLCRKYGLTQERADFLSGYYHDLGVIVHYSNDPLLKNMVIINPDWAVDGVYNVLDTRSVEENKGRFNNNDLKEIWSTPKYNKKHAELLALMKNYELCFEIGGTGFYIAPELLPANPIAYKPIQKRNRLTFIYRYKFMPAGIMSRFIVKIHGLIDDDKFWKHGLLVKFEDSRALIVEDDVNRQINIDIEGQKNKKELLAIIRKEFFDINSNFKRKIQYDELVPCNCLECIESDIPHLYKWETLKKYGQKGVDRIRCDNSLIEIDVKALVGEIADKSNWVLEEGIGLGNTSIGENGDLSVLRKTNGFAPLIIGLTWWGILALTIALFAFTQIERFFLILFIVTFVITFPLIVAYTLIDKKSLSEENFITILKMSLAKIPGLKWLNK